MGVNGIYGLSGSGLDIESMVKVGMMSKQNEYDKMQKNFTYNEWKKTAYVGVYDTLQTFNNSTLSKYKMSSSMNARSASSGNESVVTATANATAPSMTHYVTVNQTASSAYVLGTSSINRVKGEDGSIYLGDALFTSLTYNENTDTYSYTDINGNTGTASGSDAALSFSIGDGKALGTTTNSNSDVATAEVTPAASGIYEVNITSTAKPATLSGNSNNFSTEYSHNVGNLSGLSGKNVIANALFSDISYDSDTDSYTFNNNSTNSDVKLTTVAASDLSTANAFSFTLLGDEDGKTTTVSFSYQDILDGKTMSDLADRINTNAERDGVDVRASYNSETGEFSLSGSGEGSSDEIHLEIAGDDGDNMVGTNTGQLFNALSMQKTDGTTVGDFTSGQTYTITGTDAQGTINGAAVEFTGNSYDSGDGLKVTATATGSTTISAAQNTVNITFKDIYNENYSFNDFVSAVNNAGTNARASYDSVNDRFSFYNSESGEANNVTLTMGTGTAGELAASFFNQMGLYKSSEGKLYDQNGDEVPEAAEGFQFSAGETVKVSGTDAEATIDGVNYKLDSNSTTVNGVIYKFKNANVGETATVTVDQDVDKIVENMKSFIEDYNTLISDLYKLYDEEKYKNYDPLTDAQRAEMTEDQIKKWEEKAKSGLLHHDSTLGKVISSLREAVSTTIDSLDGKYNSIFSLGVTTSGTKGQLKLDEDKLRAAIAEDPDAVYNVMATLDKDDKFSGNGVAQRLGDVLNTQMKNVKSVAGSDATLTGDDDLSKLLRELQTKMSNFKSMMNAFEDALYKKYDSMEVALAKLGTQLNYVTNAFG